MKMNSMGAQAVLAVLLLIIGTVKANEEKVLFWRDSFKMICPEEGEWFRDEEKKQNATSYYELHYNGRTKGVYHCEYTTGEDDTLKKYYFYVQGKACTNCFEVDAVFIGLAIIMDMVLTTFVMMIVYRCTKKKSSPVPQSSKAPARSGGRAPPVPSPDYELLNTQTRSQDTYSFLNRTG